MHRQSKNSPRKCTPEDAHCMYRKKEAQKGLGLAFSAEEYRTALRAGLVRCA